MIVGGKKYFIVKCVFWFSLQILSETFLILRRIQRDIITNIYIYIYIYIYIGLHVKYPPFLSYFQQTWIFSYRFSKYAQLRKFMKIRTVRAELVRADRQTDMTKLTVVLCNLNSRDEITQGLLGPDGDSIAVHRNVGNCLLVDIK